MVEGSEVWGQIGTRLGEKVEVGLTRKIQLLSIQKSLRMRHELRNIRTSVNYNFYGTLLPWYKEKGKKKKKKN